MPDILTFSRSIHCGRRRALFSRTASGFDNEFSFRHSVTVLESRNAIQRLEETLAAFARRSYFLSWHEETTWQYKKCMSGWCRCCRQRAFNEKIRCIQRKERKEREIGKWLLIRSSWTRLHTHTYVSYIFAYAYTNTHARICIRDLIIVDKHGYRISQNLRS